ncbi:ASCH domain-containing protein [Geomicrobium sediminis]|uniref:ASCH domain-containing protein n=1 Tax=Geomicrobium sediminis TaxID=1347788 RepID=UPI0030846003
MYQTKTVEVRLNDQQVSTVQVGDCIRFFLEGDLARTVLCKVTTLNSYELFLALYEDIAFEQMDCSGWTMDEMMKATYKLYTAEEEKAYGALAIGVEVVDVDKSNSEDHSNGD